MIDFSALKQDLSDRGWKPKHSDDLVLSGLSYDLMMQTHSWYFADWYVLMKKVGSIDSSTKGLLEDMERIIEGKRSWWKSSIFFIYVIADAADPDIAGSLATNDSDIRDIGIKGQSARRVFVLDCRNSTLYGSLPATPLDARGKLRDINELLKKHLGKPLTIVAPDKRRKAGFMIKVILFFIIVILVGFMIGIILAILT